MPFLVADVNIRHFVVVDAIAILAEMVAVEDVVICHTTRHFVTRHTVAADTPTSTITCPNMHTA